MLLRKINLASVFVYASEPSISRALHKRRAFEISTCLSQYNNELFKLFIGVVCEDKSVKVTGVFFFSFFVLIMKHAKHSAVDQQGGLL